jgi:hypothetical protein
MINESTIFHPIPWQYAVYTSARPNDNYVFSHVELTTLEKQFPRSLAVPDIRAQGSTRSSNLETLQQATVLVLVTGKWAQHVSLDSFTFTDSRSRPPKLSLYDHLRRLGATHGSSKHCSELTLDYKVLQYHSTLCHYIKGHYHSWNFLSVLPVISDTVILPRVLDPSRVKSVINSFSRATRKCIRDSLLVAALQASQSTRKTQWPKWGRVHLSRNQNIICD